MVSLGWSTSQGKTREHECKESRGRFDGQAQTKTLSHTSEKTTEIWLTTTFGIDD
jgi:hypothetical protein